MDKLGLVTVLLAETLRGKLAEARVTQSEIAAEIGVSQSQLSKILLGKRDMTVDVFTRLCGVVDADPVALMDAAYNEATRREAFHEWLPVARYSREDHRRLTDAEVQELRENRAMQRLQGLTEDDMTLAASKRTYPDGVGDESEERMRTP